jgi:hypothetical protein
MIKNKIKKRLEAEKGNGQNVPATCPLTSGHFERFYASASIFNNFNMN